MVTWNDIEMSDEEYNIKFKGTFDKRLKILPAFEYNLFMEHLKTGGIGFHDDKRMFQYNVHDNIIPFNIEDVEKKVFPSFDRVEFSNMLSKEENKYIQKSFLNQKPIELLTCKVDILRDNPGCWPLSARKIEFDGNKIYKVASEIKSEQLVSLHSYSVPCIFSSSSFPNLKSLNTIRDKKGMWENTVAQLPEIFNLRLSPLDEAFDASCLPKKLRFLDITKGNIKNFKIFKTNLDKVCELTICDLKKLESFDGIEAFANVERITLVNCNKKADYLPITKLKKLKTIYFYSGFPENPKFYEILIKKGINGNNWNKLYNKTIKNVKS